MQYEETHRQNSATEPVPVMKDVILSYTDADKVMWIYPWQLRNLRIRRLDLADARGEEDQVKTGRRMIELVRLNHHDNIGDEEA